jgi:hypothetical protein
MMLSGLSRERAVEAAVATCLRCGGLMVSDSGIDVVVQRCVQCGERVDSVILENRQKKVA